MLEIIITSLIGLVVTITTSIVTWYLSRRKYNKEIEEMSINNEEKKFKLYTDIIENNAKMMEQMTAQNTSLMQKTFDQDKKIQEQQFVINEQQATIKQQGEKISEMESRIKELTSTIEGLVHLKQRRNERTD